MEVVLTGFNTPTRIGEAIVLPGDLVITDKEGVLFIPAHMAEMVIGTAELCQKEPGKKVIKYNRFLQNPLLNLK